MAVGAGRDRVLEIGPRNIGVLHGDFPPRLFLVIRTGDGVFAAAAVFRGLAAAGLGTLRGLAGVEGWTADGDLNIPGGHLGDLVRTVLGDLRLLGHAVAANHRDEAAGHDLAFVIDLAVHVARTTTAAGHYA